MTRNGTFSIPCSFTAALAYATKRPWHPRLSSEDQLKCRPLARINATFAFIAHFRVDLLLLFIVSIEEDACICDLLSESKSAEAAHAKIHFKFKGA